MHAAAVLRAAVRLKLIASLVASVALVLLAPVLADAFGAPALTLPLRLIAIVTAAQGLGGLICSWFTALHRVSLQLGYTLVESSFETTASIGIVLLGGGAAGAVAGRAIGFTVSAILAAALAVRLVGWPALRHGGNGFPARRIATYGIALLIIDGAYVLFDRVDVLIIGAILSTTAAGTFEAAFRIIAVLYYPALAVSAGFTPRLAAGQRTEAETSRFMGALRYMTLLHFLLAAPLLVWARPIVDLFLGAGYSGSAAVMRAMAPTLVVAGLAPILASAVNFLGEARLRVPLAIGALLLNLIIDLILVPRIGIVAGAIGTGAAFVLYTGGHIRICQRLMGVSFERLALTALRGTIAFGAAALVLFVFGTSHLGVFDWIAGTVLATGAFIGVLILVGELHRDDVRTAIRLLRVPLRRLGAGQSPAS